MNSKLPVVKKSQAIPRLRRVPVIVETEEDAESERQLPPQEHQRLRTGNVAARDGPRGCPTHLRGVQKQKHTKKNQMRRHVAPGEKPGPDCTFLSNSLSHMSLTVQPAPRISTAPAPNRASVPKSGRQPGSAASAMLQLHGRYSSHVPAAAHKLQDQPNSA